MVSMEENNTQEKSYGYAKRPLWQWILLYAVIGIFLYGLIYYMFLAKKGGSGYSPQTSSPTSVPLAQSPAVSAREITISGDEFKFDPAAITVSAGQPVTLTFINAGTYPHNFTVSDLNISTRTIQPGEQDTIQFTPDKPGQFTYTCTVDTHAASGMTGTLTVQ